MRARQRGFALTAQAWMALGGLALVIAGLVAFNLWLSGVKSEAYDRGAADKQAQWDRAKLAAEELRRMKEAAVNDALLEEQKKREAAEATADQNEAKWKEAKRAADRTGSALASCQIEAGALAAYRDDAPGAGPVVADRAGGAADAPAPAARAPARAVPGIRLHWRFVWLHDAAFTGLDGQPVSSAAARDAGGAPGADTPSPYGLGELLEVNGENARKLSACRRDVAEARAKVERAAIAWDEARAR